jgi:hypothetical protein
MGYELNFFGRRFTHAVKTMLVAVSPEDGRVLESHPIPDTSKTLVELLLRKRTLQPPQL